MPSNSNPGHYDQSLLSDAPAVTRQMRQEGYNPDILAAQQKPATLSKENLTSARQSPIERPPTRVPFWRTTKGIIAIAVLVLVVIGAVVGGAVGGTRRNKKGSSEPVNGTDTTVQAPGGGAETGNPGGNVGSTAAPTSTSGSGQEVGSSGVDQPVSPTSSSQGAQNSQTTGDQTSRAGTGGQTEGTGNGNGGNVNGNSGTVNIADRIAGGALGGR